MYERSRELYERSLELIPGGVNSPVRAFRAVGGTPVFFREARGSRLAMKTLSDQVVRDGEEESEAEVQLAFTCPSCGETNKVNLPEGWTVAEGEEEEEAEGRGQRLRTKCSKCGETYSVEPPDGTHFGRRKAAGEAARAFARDYGRAIEASRLRHGALRIL